MKTETKKIIKVALSTLILGLLFHKSERMRQGLVQFVEWI